MEKKLGREIQKENFISNKINCHQFGGFIGKLEAERRDKRNTEKGRSKRVREKLWHQMIVISRSKISRRWTI